MPTIFIDEAGYTGQNLLDPAQPVFALASICLPEEECRALKDQYFTRITAAELKYSSVKKSTRQQKLLLNFLNDLKKTPQIVKFNVVDKKIAARTVVFTGRIIGNHCVFRRKYWKKNLGELPKSCCLDCLKRLLGRKKTFLKARIGNQSILRLAKG